MLVIVGINIQHLVNHSDIIDILNVSNGIIKSFSLAAWATFFKELIFFWQTVSADFGGILTETIIFYVLI